MTMSQTMRHWAALRVFPTAVAMMVAWLPAEAEAQPAGAQTAGAQPGSGADKFNSVCGACHTIGGGQRVGPDLKGVHERRTEAWLLEYVKSPQKMMDKGDPIAVQLKGQFPLVMPDPPYTEAELVEILAYIKTGGTGAAAPEAPARAATPQDIQRGLDLFQGTVRLGNGGPACNSCHHVRNDAVIGGGVLARELTTVFGRMGGSGINAILGKPPFPVMNEAYREHPLTEDEVFSLVSFLQDADKRQAFQQPRDYGFKLLYSGGAGFVVLMGVFGLFGRRRKRLPVNHAIFDRQVKSQGS